MSTAYLSDETVEQFREPAFVALLFIGAIVFALGGAFLVVGISINTAPPAPYVTPTDKWLLVAVSAVAMVVGAAMIRFAAKIVGW